MPSDSTNGGRRSHRFPKTDETDITLKAIYEVPPTPEAAQYKVWTGRLESRTYNFKLRQW